MKRRLDIAMTLVGNPRIIFLDEPTTGLDPRSRHNMWQIIRELVSDGVTVFLTTQYLEEADELADRIAVLNDGKIAAEGTAEELKRLIPGGHVRLRFADPAAYQSAAFALREATRDDEALALQIPSDGSQRELRSILDRLDSAGIEADELTVHTPDLDDVFFALTGTAAARPVRPASPRRPSDELPLPRRTRLVHDAAPQPPARAALPVPHPEPAAHPDHAAAALRLHLRRHDERGHRRRSGPLRRTSPMSSRACC